MKKRKKRVTPNAQDQRQLSVVPNEEVPQKAGPNERRDLAEKKRKEAEKGRKAWLEMRMRRKSFGRIVPQPHTPEGKSVACPCGRVYLLAHADGGYLFFDKEGPLGSSTLGGGYREMDLMKAKRLVEHHGCWLHKREDMKRKKLGEGGSAGP